MTKFLAASLTQPPWQWSSLVHILLGIMSIEGYVLWFACFGGSSCQAVRNVLNYKVKDPKKPKKQHICYTNSWIKKCDNWKQTNLFLKLFYTLQTDSSTVTVGMKRTAQS